MTIKIKLCMGSACFARGNDRNLALLQKYIAEKKLDARIELSGGRCEGRCGAGPNIYVDGVCHSGMTEEKLRKLLADLKL